MDQHPYSPPSPRDRIDDPFAPTGAQPPRPVDWWAWQSRIRDVSTPVRTPMRSAGRRPPFLARAGLGLLVGVALVVAAFGGVVFGGRPTDAVRTHPLAAPLPPGGGTPPEYVVVEEPPPPTPEPEPGPAPEPARPPVTATRPAPPPGGRFGVDQVVLDLTYGGRRLQTVVRFPTDRGAGPFPLVVFAYGYATQTSAYGALLDGIASYGFVVAAPEFPFTSTAYGDDIGGRDVEAQVDDVSHVITAVRDVAHTRGTSLDGLVDNAGVGVVGHSDGGVTAAAVAFASQVRDPRITAAVVLSGARDDFGGSWFPSGSPALLAIHGDADGVNPFGASQTLYSSDRSGSPRYLVAVPGGGHNDAFVGSRTRDAVAALASDFLRAYLVGDADARARITDDAAYPGVLELLASDD
jgi:predicted dienelactone hydrolase